MTLQGPQPVAILLCRLKDSAGTQPHPPSYYRALLKRGTGGLNDYWIAASLNAINLDGSRVFGWTTLDVDRADFLAANPKRGDKIEAAKARFDVDYSGFASVIALYNVDVTDGGGSSGNVLGGPGNGNVTFLAHELGHSFEIEHSFDRSDRKKKYGQKGEYFDRHDIMSAMNVEYDPDHRFSPRGPLLNTANLDRMGWLPPSRLWRAPKNSSGVHDVELAALSHPEAPGHLAAQAGGWIAEFRMPSGFDAGLVRPAVLFHDHPADPNSFIIASDPFTHNHEWLPGQVHWHKLAFEEFGGVKATVVDFDLRRKTAHLRVEVKAVRPPFVDPDILFGLGIGQLPVDGKLLVWRNGKIVPIPVPEPDIVSRARDLAALDLLLQLTRRRPG